MTGLRIFAAVAVFGSHVAIPAGAPDWVEALRKSGSSGVTFFFVLSGFVLALNYFDGLGTPQQIWRYTAARFARVYPLYLVVLCWPAVHQWGAGELSKREFLQHALGLQAWSPDMDVAYGFVGPAWSISVELFLYATLPLLVPVVRLVDRRIRLVVGALVLVVVALCVLVLLFQASGRAGLPPADPASAYRWLYRTPLLRVGDFLLGILAARLFLRLRERASGERLGGWLTVTAIAVSLGLGAQPALFGTPWSFDVAYATPATALILGLALAPRHPVSRLLSRRTIVFLGEASFAFYLVHVTVINMVGAGRWTAGFTIQGAFLEAVYLGLALALAIGLHTGIEKPARRLVMGVLVRDRAPRPVARSAGQPPTPRPAHENDPPAVSAPPAADERLVLQGVAR